MVLEVEVVMGFWVLVAWANGVPRSWVQKLNLEDRFLFRSGYSGYSTCRISFFVCAIKVGSRSLLRDKAGGGP